MSYLQAALKVIKQEDIPKTEPTIRLIKKQTSMIRPESLEEVLNAIVLASCNRIIEALKGKQYRASDAIRKTEEDVNHLYHEVLNGQASLVEYQAACKRWERLFICGD